MTLGIASDGQKHALGLWDGSTENARVCQDLPANLHSRGLRTDRSLLVILDGSKALRKAVRTIFGEAALVQGCQGHKMRSVLEYSLLQAARKSLNLKWRDVRVVKEHAWKAKPARLTEQHGSSSVGRAINSTTCPLKMLSGVTPYTSVFVASVDLTLHSLHSSGFDFRASQLHSYEVLKQARVTLALTEQ